MQDKIELQNKVIQDLKDGNQRFTEGKSIHSSESSIKKLKDFAKSAQTPKAIVLCCSDSRAPVELIFDQDIGDLFVIRVAGNVVAPSLVGSVEFAASLYGVSVVLVMGHSMCGAVTATLNHIENSQAVSSANINDIVSRIKPHVFPIAQMSDKTFEERLTVAVRANVVASVGQLSTSSRIIEDLIQKKKLRILGSVLDLETGQVSFLKS